MEQENVLDLMVYLIVFFVLAFILVNFILPKTSGAVAVDWEKSSVIILIFVMAFLVSMNTKWLKPVPVKKGSKPSSPLDHMEEKLISSQYI